MTEITHHVPDAMLAAYAAGSLPQAFSTVVAAHVSLCGECRAALETHHTAGGVVLDVGDPAEISDHLRSDVLSRLDAPFKADPVYARNGIYPGPVMAALGGRQPRWKPIGLGVRQSILSAGREGSVRLLHIPGGQAVPDHSHGGLEFTLVLQGSFKDETGRFGPGDIEIADEDLEHTPVAEPGAPCICLAATDAPLRFSAFLPRLLQPIFRI